MGSTSTRSTRSGTILSACFPTASRGSGLAELSAATTVQRLARPRQPRRFRLRMRQVRPRSRSVKVATDQRRPLQQLRIRPLRQQRRPETAATPPTVAAPNLRPRQGLIPAEANHKMEQRPPARERPSVRATSATTSAGGTVGAPARKLRTGSTWTTAASTASTETFLGADAKRILGTDTRIPASGDASIGGGAVSLHRARALHRLRRLGTPGLGGWLPIVGRAPFGKAQRRTPSADTG